MTTVLPELAGITLLPGQPKSVLVTDSTGAPYSGNQVGLTQSQIELLKLITPSAPMMTSLPCTTMVATVPSPSSSQPQSDMSDPSDGGGGTGAMVIVLLPTPPMMKLLPYPAEIVFEPQSCGSE